MVAIESPATAMVTDELRLHDRIAHRLPAHAAAAVEELDPERRGGVPHEPVRHHRRADPRPAGHRRPAARRSSTSRTSSWPTGSGPPPASRRPRRIVSLDGDGPARATARAGRPARRRVGGRCPRRLQRRRATTCAGSSTTRTGGPRRAFFAPRCDRVRVMPFLDGRAVLDPRLRAARRHRRAAGPGRDRDPAQQRGPDLRVRRARHVVGPAPADREAMRDAVRRVGDASASRARLPRRVRDRRRADRRRLPARPSSTPGCRPVRHGGRRSTRGCSRSSRPTWWPGVDTGLSVADVESLVPLMDATRTGKVVAVAEGPPGRAATVSYPVVVRRHLVLAGRSPRPATRSWSPTPRPASSPKVDPCARWRPASGWQRVNVALLRVRGPRARHRRSGRWSPRPISGPRVTAWRGWWWSGGARRARLRGPAGQARPRGHPGRALGQASAARSRRSPPDGFAWDAGPTYTLLPAVVRDLFRKSGPAGGARARTWCRSTSSASTGSRTAPSVRLPGGSRAAQLAAFDELGAGLGQRWVDHVASYADDWDVLRRGYLEDPWTPDDLPRDLAARLDSRETLHKRLRQDVQGRAAAAGRRPPVRRRRATSRATCRRGPG